MSVGMQNSAANWLVLLTIATSNNSSIDWHQPLKLLYVDMINTQYSFMHIQFTTAPNNIIYYHIATHCPNMPR